MIKGEWQETLAYIMYMWLMYKNAPIRIDEKRYRYDIGGEIIPYYKHE